MREIVALYKPKGPTSHDIVDQVRRITGIRKVGHAGTLDPLASGVLVIGIGRGTKQLATIVSKSKEYVATVRFGATSTTDDAEGVITPVVVEHQPTLAEIKITVRSFIGTIQQIPPQFSAIKVKGKPAHRRARQGEQVPLLARPVVIERIAIVHYQWPQLTVEVTTGPGVYIRALARDIGKQLSCGGYLAALERTRVGDFTTTHSVSIKEFERSYG